MRRSWTVAITALAGVGVCTAALIHFLLTILYNKLPWSPDQPVRDHYLAVGNSYSQGFIVGFFLCFSLAVLAVAVASMKERHRAARQSNDSSDLPKPRPKPRIVAK
jgi:hypothetical protein